MSRRESRTISVLEGDWDRWADLAYAARISRSEYIRRAVEEYATATDAAPCARDHRLHAATQEAIGRIDGIRSRSPIPKELQTRRRKG